MLADFLLDGSDSKWKDVEGVTTDQPITELHYWLKWQVFLYNIIPLYETANVLLQQQLQIILLVWKE